MINDTIEKESGESGLCDNRRESSTWLERFADV
jgi:hypothetical protein